MPAQHLWHRTAVCPVVRPRIWNFNHHDCSLRDHTGEVLLEEGEMEAIEQVRGQ